MQLYYFPVPMLCKLETFRYKILHLYSLRCTPFAVRIRPKTVVPQAEASESWGALARQNLLVTLRNIFLELQEFQDIGLHDGNCPKTQS